MNCKPGDLAIVVRAPREGQQWSLGKVVKVTLLLPEEERACWVLAEPVIAPDGQLMVEAYDDILKPLPPDDETEVSRNALEKTV